MKYRFHIGFTGTIEQEDNESLRDVEQAIRDSVQPDLVAGVVITGLSINVDQEHNYNIPPGMSVGAQAKPAQEPPKE